MSEREEYVSNAKLAQEAGNYDEMIKNMKQVISLDAELTDEERNLLAVAYKSAIDNRRATTEKNVHNRELQKICYDVLSLLDQHLIPSAASIESKVFYQAMQGECFQNIAENSPEDDRMEAVNNALKNYEIATDTAMNELLPTDLTRLKLALNHGEFYYKIMESPSQASHIAKTAFDDATAELARVSQDVYEETLEWMQKLIDKVNSWTPDEQGREAEEQGQDDGGELLATLES